MALNGRSVGSAAVGGVVLGQSFAGCSSAQAQGAAIATARAISCAIVSGQVGRMTASCVTGFALSNSSGQAQGAAASLVRTVTAVVHSGQAQSLIGDGGEAHATFTVASSQAQSVAALMHDSTSSYVAAAQAQGVQAAFTRTVTAAVQSGQAQSAITDCRPVVTFSMTSFQVAGDLRAQMLFPPAIGIAYVPAQHHGVIVPEQAHEAVVTFD